MAGYKCALAHRPVTERGSPRAVLTGGERRRRNVRARRGPPGRRPRPVAPSGSAAHARFRQLDRERALREWRRYEGTAQRDLFRELRERFLRRHASPHGWALDVGSGPGRFLPAVGGDGARRVALDLSRAMLVAGRELAASAVGPSGVDRVLGDALRPPLRAGAFAEVAMVGNALGFEAGAGVELLDAVEQLIEPGGTLVVEIAPGAGERSRYLGRLPPGAVGRLLAAPPGAILPRLRREGFAPEAPRHRPGSFRRWSVEELLGRWRPRGWSVREAMAVAPALGADPARLEEVGRDRKAWARLLELEEALGREPERWAGAAAVLVAAERPALPANDFVRGPASLHG